MKSKKVCFYVNRSRESIMNTEMYLNDIKILKNLGFEVDITNNLFELIKSEADFYFCWWASSSFPAVIMSKIRRKPCFIIAAGTEASLYPIKYGYYSKPLLYKEIVKFNLRNSFVLPVSNELRKMIKKIEPEVRMTNTIYNCIDLTDYIKVSHKNRSNTILSIGSLEEVKNHIVLLKAFHILKKEFPNISLTIGGPEGDRNELLEEYIRENQITDVKILNYFIKKDEKIKLYQETGIYVFPSLYETFGLTMAEALASGLPTIASNAGAIPEVIGSAGILFNPKNEKELAEKIRSLLNNPKKAKELGLKARKRILSNFSIKNREENLKKIFEKYKLL